MENKCEHPPRYRETYREGLFKCYACNKVITDKFPLSDSDLKLIDDIDKMYGTGKYKKNNMISRLSNDTKSWILSVTGISTVALLIYVISHYETTLWVILAICGVAMFGVLVYSIKELIKVSVFNDYE